MHISDEQQVLSAEAIGTMVPIIEAAKNALRMIDLLYKNEPNKKPAWYFEAKTALGERGAK